MCWAFTSRTHSRCSSTVLPTCTHRSTDTQGTRLGMVWLWLTEGPRQRLGPGQDEKEK